MALPLSTVRRAASARGQPRFTLTPRARVKPDASVAPTMQSINQILKAPHEHKRSHTTSQRNHTGSKPRDSLPASPLAYTRYSFTPRLLCTNQSSLHYPSQLHRLHGCNTIAILLRSIHPPSEPPVFIPYTVQCCALQYLVKANSPLLYACRARRRLWRRHGATKNGRRVHLSYLGPASSWPLHDIVMTNMVWCIAYKREFGGGVVYCLIIGQWYCNSEGNAGEGGGDKRGLIRAHEPRSKNIYCKGQAPSTVRHTADARVR